MEGEMPNRGFKGSKGGEDSSFWYEGEKDKWWIFVSKLKNYINLDIVIGLSGQ